MHKRSLGLVAAVLLLAPGAGRAAVVLDLDLPEMTRRAVRVVHAVVLGEKVELDGEGRPVTESTLKVLDALKGSPERRIVVRQVGGDKDGRALRIEGSPYLGVGDEVVLFLEPQPSRAGTFVPVGLATAVWKVRLRDGRKEASRDLAGLGLARPSPRGLVIGPPRQEPALALEELKRRVRAAVRSSR